MKKETDRSLITWLLTGCLLVLLMVVVGGVTRLTHSGLSIVKWDLIMGTLPPLNEQAWQEAFEQYKQFPEYQLRHSHFQLADFKSIFFWEYSHRLLGRLIGLVFLLPFLYFWLRGRISRQLLPRLLLIFGLGALQGFLGWYMVKSGLADKPFVSHYRLAIHLLTAFITFGYILWVALGEYYKGTKQAYAGEAKLYHLTVAYILLLGLQLVYGAFVAGLKAGFIFNTFPKMGEHWIAAPVTAMDPLYLNFLEGPAGVQFIHRCLAMGLLALSGYLWLRSRRAELNHQSKAGIRLLLLFTLAQVGSGILTLLYAVPLPLGIIHQAGAFLLLGTGLYVLYHLSATGPEYPLNDQPTSAGREVHEQLNVPAVSPVH